MVEVSFDRHGLDYCPMESVCVTVEWSSENIPKKLQMEVLWQTEGKGTSDDGVFAIEEWTDFPNAGKRQWSFQLPRGPESMEGKHFRIQWYLTCKADREDKRYFPFVVSRTRSPIQLARDVSQDK